MESPKHSSPYYRGDDGTLRCNKDVKYLSYSEISNKDTFIKVMFQTAWNVTCSNCDDIGPLPPPSTFNTIRKLVGSYDIFGSKRMYAYYMYSESLKQCIISFSGTEYLDEWQDDIDYSQTVPGLTNTDSEDLVHEGFLFVYNQVRDKLREFLVRDAPVVINVSGYSLGGGVSQLCALDLSTPKMPHKLRLVTFAAPRCLSPRTSQKLADFCEYTRVVNSEDIIPTLPPPIILDPFSWSNYYYYSHASTPSFMPHSDTHNTHLLYTHPHTHPHLHTHPYSSGGDDKHKRGNSKTNSGTNSGTETRVFSLNMGSFLDNHTTSYLKYFYS